MPLIRIFLFFLFLGSSFLKAEPWHLVQFGKSQYVPLEDFCRFYHFSTPDYYPSQPIHLSNGINSLDFLPNTSFVYIDGVKHWLSFPIVERLGQIWISRTDLCCLFEPLLRPGMIPTDRLYRGVVIDPGHGGSDKGAVSRKGTEKNYALDTARRLAALLKARGIPVVMTRNKDVFVSLDERIRMASHYPDYIFVSIHYNQAYGGGHGLETYALSPRGSPSTNSRRLYLTDYSPSPGNRTDSLNILLAHDIHSQIIRLHPYDSDMDRGLKRARFKVLRENSLPSVLVEGGFLSNSIESSLVDHESYRQKLAEAIARGILTFFNQVNPQKKKALQKSFASDGSEL
ncbi:N-acetylmuramoyl-L-alanine amidase [Candidatus Methylacidiphilum infernorum]|uniref:N-acetylmuramoyl-L-alanine amidase n=1 Tax=Candidatus Methylacidiphilum infernorum TaxID=511746 RepID=A0ABX7PWW5_9BACT|nr:N-acetylmuramoyl-L-alanine amidase [Candidatus Methylacidiphilum infernorum]QSR87510.1 N-acetylmuramoyl-L-alanine amidase [Candidatus Methylacidiphilum infernorum]